MTDRYILINGNPVPEPDLMKWGEWLQSSPDRIIKKDIVDEVEISTVFLGLDHSFSRGRHLPVLFETMIFGGEHDNYQERYTFKEDAIMGHKKALSLVRRVGKRNAETSNG